MRSFQSSFLASLLSGLALMVFIENARAEDLNIVAGEAFFNLRCQTCHNPEAKKQTYGPSLNGVVGRPAGSIAEFTYSQALKSSGIVWTEASLAAWMADNDGMLPGTRMRHVGVEDKAEQEMIIAYLKSLAN